MRVKGPIACLLLLGSCGSGNPNLSLAGSEPLEGIAILGAFEGQEFLICDPDEPETCRSGGSGKRCALENSGSASKAYSAFLQEHGLAAEGAATIRIKGTGVLVSGETYGHLGVNDCQVTFESIDEIALAPPQSKSS